MHSFVSSARGALALSLASLLSLSISTRLEADVTVSSAPVGYYRIPLTEGFQTVGVSLVSNPTLVSLIDSTGSDTVSLTEEDVEVGSLLLAETTSGDLEDVAEYYVEIVEGPAGIDDTYVGHRLEVDEEETVDGDVEDGQIAIDTSADLTTLELQPDSGPEPDLEGYRMELRKHVTLGEAFNKDLLHASTQLSNADQIQYFDGSKFVVYYLLTNATGTIRAWGNSNFSSAEGVVIPPGVGLVYKRSSQATGTTDLVISGKVRTNPFHQPLKEGFNFVAEPYPITTNFVEREALAPTFTPNFSASQADQLQVLENGKFVTYHLFGDETASGWVLTSNPIALENETDLFDYRHPVFFKKKADSDSYRVPLSWTP